MGTAAKVVTSFISISKGLMTIGKFLKANPILLAITAIAVGAYLIYKYWDQISAFFIKLWDGVKQVFSAAWQWIKEMFLNYTATGLVIKNWDKIKLFFSKLWSGIKNVFRATWEWIKNMFLN